MKEISVGVMPGIYNFRLDNRTERGTIGAFADHMDRKDIVKLM
jgi:hypothetical protein